jgi:type IV pilus assembly protein PilV
MAFNQNVDANELNLANNLATDLIERIQFNRKNVITYNNLTVTPTANNCPAAANVPPPNNTTTTQGDCLQWQALMAASTLNAVNGVVTLNPVPPAVDPNGLNQTTVTVRIAWTGRSRSLVPHILNRVTVVAPE